MNGMEPFTTLTAIAVPIDEPNIDTQQLCPARFNKLPRGPQYAKVLFNERRFNADGTAKDFFLNREPFCNAQIIVGAANFGCGSSRESAVYALEAFGIRCVIAPSFSDIFADNCYKNGLLTVVLPEAEVAAIRQGLHERPGTPLTVDLAAQTVRDATGKIHPFEIHPVRRQCLLEGLDDVARTKQYRPQIEAFESAYRKERPWLF
jgi:3-isopropylmalate/(R)-2-methylmalate dehydratase small subunit